MVLMTSIAGCIGVIRPIVRKVALVEASAAGESRIADNLKFSGLFSFRFLWLPSYFRYFDSYCAPFRPSVDFKTVPGDLAQLKLKSPVVALKRLGGKKRMINFILYAVGRYAGFFYSCCRLSRWP